MRTIEEIKTEMTDRYAHDPEVIRQYGLDPNKSYDDQFSKLSLSSILFYCMAVAIWMHEQIIDVFKTDVNRQIEEFKPHSLRWYRNKTLDFRFGQALINETDRYDDSGLSFEAIEKSKVVRYVAVSEAKDASMLYLKIAGESAEGRRQPITQEQLEALAAYLREIKDAGVYIQVINRQADRLKLSLKVYYDPMVLNQEGNGTNGQEQPVRQAVKSYVENLPFNGEYRNADLIDVLQKLPGVVIPELVHAESKYGDRGFEPINARCRPDAGYFAFANDEDLTITYHPYEEVI